MSAPPLVRAAARRLRQWAATAQGRHVVETLGLYGTRLFPSRAEIFEHIYATSAWGDSSDGGFFSGVGSRGPAASEYVEKMTAILGRLQADRAQPPVVVDIGCGDFEIGRRLLEKLPGIHYIGCDIVRPLIEHHQANHAGERVSFQHLDIVLQTPPAGDVCLVRQVFQHLSNDDILRALRNLSGFPFVYVTEGQPEFPSGPVNPDKVVDAKVRFDWEKGIGRGVELAEPPFSLRVEELFRCRVPPHEYVVTQQVFL